MRNFDIIKKLFGITDICGFDISEINAIKSIFGDLPKVFIDYYNPELSSIFLQCFLASSFKSFLL